MRNPFLNTEGYTIGKQLFRINNKGRQSRSNSINSSNSQWSDRKSRSNSNCSQKQNIFEPYNRCKRQYFISSSIYELEAKRVKVFGIQQLRYKPLYFKLLNQFQHDQQKSPKSDKKQQIINTSVSTNKKQHTLKSVNSIKSAKSVKSIKFKSIQQNSKHQINVEDRILEKRSNRKRGSVLEQMIDLNVEKIDNCDFYASADNYKSHFDLNTFAPTLRRQKKKISLFYNQPNYAFNSSLRNSRTNYQTQMDSNQTSQHITKDYFQSQNKISQTSSNKTQMKSKLKIKQEKPPNKIYIRNKIYYRYRN